MSMEAPLGYYEQILQYLKNRIGGLPAECVDFDTDIISHANRAFFTLWQLGINRCERPFTVDTLSTWFDFDPGAKVPCLMDYVFYKTKLGLDSTTMSAKMVDYYKEECLELEQRMRYEAELT